MQAILILDENELIATRISLKTIIDIDESARVSNSIRIHPEAMKAVNSSLAKVNESLNTLGVR